MRDAIGPGSSASSVSRARPGLTSSSSRGTLTTTSAAGVSTGPERGTSGSARTDPTASGSTTDSSRGFSRQSSDGTSSGGQSYRDAIASARTQLAVAAGLVELAARNFRGAAMSFLQVRFSVFYSVRWGLAFLFRVYSD